MSSGGGYVGKAAGSGLSNEGKFRQRVDDHYKVMAGAKKTIRIASSMHSMTACMLCTIAGIALQRWVTYGDELVGDGIKLVGFMSTGIMILSGTCGLAANNAVGAMKDAEKHTASYATRLKLLAASLVSTGAYSAFIFKPPPQVDLPPDMMLYACAGMWVLALLSVLVGLRGAGQLTSAFEQQKAKSKAK